jgi:hypothetical protein
VLTAQDSYALIAGSVFRPNGTAFPSIEVVLTPEPDAPADGKKVKKPKALKETSNFRGEFTFRVPAKPMRYTLSVRTSGFKPLLKTVQVAGDERQDVSLMLEPGQ